MGVQTAEARLTTFASMTIPSDHLLRSIDGHLDLDGLRQTLKPFYTAHANGGRSRRALAKGSNER
jgi:hypothetical protein